jgi:hypothetical protein
MGLALNQFDARDRVAESFGKHLDASTRGTLMKYISNCLVACAIAAASAPAAALNTVTLDFTSATAGAPLAAAYGNPNAAAAFTWTGVDVWDIGATATPNNSIYSASGNVLIAAVGGQTISQVKFDYFTYYDSDITSNPTSNVWSLLDGSGATLFSGTMNAAGGADNTDKPVQSFVLDLSGVDYSTVRLTFSNDTAMGFDNFSVTAVPAIPEPETYALMLAGLGVVGFMARRRKAK